MYSTGTKPTKEKLKKIFATHGTPVQVVSDNGPPFQSKEFTEFAAVEGFRLVSSDIIELHLCTLEQMGKQRVL